MKKKILILAGGYSKERDISLITAKSVYKQIKNNYSCKILDPKNGFIKEIRKFKPNVIFNALHGRYGEDGYIQLILENEKITKIGHYLRYDVSGLEYFLKCEVKNIFDTKLASKLCRTYSQNHGLKDLVLEFCGKKLDKRLGSSDWNKKLDELTDAQLQYCSNDVIYLHKIKDELYKMLVRENRLELYESSIDFLKTRIKLDQSGFTEDIFQH